MRSLLVLACLSAVLLGACASSSRAGAMATAYLDAVRGGSIDRGWSLLHPEMQARVFGGDAHGYIGTMRAADWSRFEWRIVEVIADDASLHFVRLELPHGAASVPLGLRSIGTWSILQMQPDGRAQIDVRVGGFGTSAGIWAAGG